MKRLRVLLATSLAFLVAAGMASCSPAADNRSEESAADTGESSGFANTQPGGSLREGDLAPDFSFALSDGSPAALSDYRGQVVVVNQWASWCRPCLGEMPDLKRLSQDYPDVVIIAVNVNDHPDDARQVIEELDASFIWVIDDGSISRLYPTDGIPYTVVITPEGVIDTIFVGSYPDMYEYFEQAVLAAGV